MPERYTLTCSAEKLQEELGVEVPEDYQPRYNAAPAQLLPIITGDAAEGLSMFYWGTIPGWAGNKAISNRIINIHQEILLSKTVNKRLLAAQRCVIPADGFYIWKQVGKKTRIPHRVESTDKSIFLFPGIWEEFEDENDQVYHTFKVIVTDPEDILRDVSETMPVIMTPAAGLNWLKQENSMEDLVDVLKLPMPLTLRYYPVSSSIDRLDRDHPGLIQEVDSMNQFGNYSLFD